MNPLESAILKAEWAHSHLHLLYSDVERVFGPKMQRIPGDFDMQKSLCIVRRKVGEAPWNEWALMVGDAATNLRDSLDHIAYQLALQTTKDEGVLEHVYFPLLYERNNRNFASATRRFKPEARKEIERFQPYHAPNPLLYPLAFINEVARISKHRYINIMIETVGFNPHDVPIGGSVDISLDDTNVIAEVRGIPHSEDELKPETSIEPHIELVDAMERHHFSFRFLHEAYTIIAEEVIPAFSGILPETNNPL